MLYSSKTEYSMFKQSKPWFFTIFLFQMVGFTTILFVITLSYTIGSLSGGLRFETIKLKNSTVICTVEDGALTTQVGVFIAGSVISILYWINQNVFGTCRVWEWLIIIDLKVAYLLIWRIYRIAREWYFNFTCVVSLERARSQTF